MNKADILEDLLSLKCRCGNKKARRQPFCAVCARTKLSDQIKKRLYSDLSDESGRDFEAAYIEALKNLKLFPQSPFESRDSGGAWHVGYLVNDEAAEIRNMTHHADGYSVEDLIENDPEIESEQEWSANANEGFVMFSFSEDSGGDDEEVFTHHISVETALQMADMFTRAAAAASRQKEEILRRETEIRERIDSQNLPFDGGD